MEKNKKKELRKQYENRHPDAGIACWQSGEHLWIAPTKDAKADFNGTSFQLRLGSWPNREMQKLYREDPESFQWSLLRELEYEDVSDDLSEDLEILLLEVQEEYPDAKPMKPGKKIR